MQANNRIRIGVVGAGANTTSRHIPGLQAIAGVEVVSVCNRSRASSQRVADQFGIPIVYENWLDLVNAVDTKAIVIGTWPYLHHPITLAALAAGKHVLCEARLAMNAAQAREMLAAARAKPHLVAQVVPSPFTLPFDRAIQRLLAEGYLGDVLMVEVLDQGAFLDEAAPLHWRHDFDLSGVNTLSLGIWYEAVMRWVGEAVRVTAMGKTFVRMRRDPESGRLKSVRIPEHIDVLAEMACGSQAHFSISRVAGFGQASQATLYGSLGTLRIADGKLYGGQRGEAGLREIPISENEAGGWRVEEEFIAAIRGTEQITHTTFQDGVKYMEFTEAAVRSMLEGRAIPLPLMT
jgi:predicted dehydrogenase